MTCQPPDNGADNYQVNCSAPDKSERITNFALPVTGNVKNKYLNHGRSGNKGIFKGY